MRWEYWLAAGFFALVIVTWVTLLASSGTVERVDERGIQMRTLLRSAKFIRWEDLTGPAQQFEKFLPRVVFKRTATLRTFHNSYAIFLRNRPAEASLIDQLSKRVGIRVIRKVGELLR